MKAAVADGPERGVDIRAAAPDDLDAITALEEEALGRDAWSRGLLAAGLAGEVPTVAYLAATVAGEDGIAGYAVVSRAGEVAELQRIAVHEDRRRRRVATALLDAVRDYARRDPDAVRLLLEVREDNDGARAFYAGSGFAELARRLRYYDDGAAAVVLGLDLTVET